MAWPKLWGESCPILVPPWLVEPDSGALGLIEMGMRMKKQTGILGWHNIKAPCFLAICFISIFMLFIHTGLASGSVQVLLQDQFNSENKGQAIEDFKGFSNWDVKTGKVNLKDGQGDKSFSQHGIYVELVGQKGEAVKLISKQELELKPGRYYLHMDLAGEALEPGQPSSQNLVKFFGMAEKKLPGPSQVSVQLGQALLANFNVEPGQPFRKVSLEFEVSQEQKSRLELSKANSGSGMVLLDNLLLSFEPPDPEADKEDAAQSEESNAESAEPSEADLLALHIDDATRSLLTLGDESLVDGSLQAAEAYYQAAQVLDPENSLAGQGLKTVRERIREHEERMDNTVFERSLELLRDSAQKGQAQAQYILGVIIENGLKTPGLTVHADAKQALEWYRKAADQNHALATVRVAEMTRPKELSEQEKAAQDPKKLFALGQKYYEGKITPKDVKRAADYFEQAAALGHSRAAFVLYELYEKGADAPRDIKTALAWLRRAAELGEAEAQYFYAFAKLEGLQDDGVKIEPDPAEGLKWLGESAKNGYEKAAQELKVIKQLVRVDHSEGPPTADKPEATESGKEKPSLRQQAADRLAAEAKPPVNLIRNGSFENGEPVGAFVSIKAGTGLLDSWQVLKGSVDMLGSPWPAAHGKQSLDLHGAFGVGVIRQTFSTVPGKSYEVGFDMAGDPECGSNIRRLKVSAGEQTSEFSFDPSGKSRQDMGWTTNKWRFRARQDQTTLEFISLSIDNSLCGPLLDNISVTEVPEP